MKLHQMLALGLASFFLVACETRSISNSGYNSRVSPFNHRLELSELDFLGTAPAGEVTQSNITQALEESSDPKIRRGDKLMVIQSGAMVPDNGFLQQISTYYSVAPFSGVPPTDRTNLTQSLRLRAAQGGYRYILCYWGVIESAQKAREGRAVSWVPIAGSFVPDQKEEMRVRLKAILLDVANGHWKMLMSEPQQDAKFNSRKYRAEEDQELVEELKDRAYKNLVDQIVFN